jgi:1-aminocyclopropane-1-carboxylate deaminase/D-cysteine desulfhydrase-like pyridoxal-dependent ACC family enzyme
VEHFDIKNTINDNIYIKRDDLSAVPYGGNKPRKLEFLLFQDNGQHKKKGPVITIGGIGSHHVLATSLYARLTGRKTIGILVRQPLTDHTKKIFSQIQRNCDTVITFENYKNFLKNVIKNINRNVISSSTIIGPGGSSPKGTLGYVFAAFEISKQIAENRCIMPDEVWVALGSGGTAAGLALGFAMLDMPIKTIAVRVATPVSGNNFYMRHLIKKTYELFVNAGWNKNMPIINMQIVHTQAGKGYGYETAMCRQAIENVESCGIAIEPTYTAKAVAELMHRAGNYSPLKKRLFINTHGQLHE